MKATARWAGIVAFTLATGIATHVIIDAFWRDDYTGGHANALAIFAILGAAAGFWFAWTGRLARLFRKVG